MEERKVEALLLNITEVSKALRLSRTKVYQLIASDGLPIIRFGKSVRVSVWSLQDWIKQKEGVA